MMDLEKIGNFIAMLRKEKGLTQEKLGEALGVSSKTISKWERGVNAPDISLLNSLSSILEVDVEELLNGEKKEKKNVRKKRKKLIFKIVMGFFILVLLSFPILFTIFNYNTVQIYCIESKTDQYLVDGFAMFNQARNLILIHNIDLVDSGVGTVEEDKIKTLQVSFVSGDKTISSFRFDSSDSSTFQPLHFYLINRVYYVDAIVENEPNTIEIRDLDQMKIYIEYTNQDDKQKEIEIPLKITKEYANTKLWGGL